MQIERKRGHHGARPPDTLFGVEPDIPLDPRWSGYETALEKVIDEKPISHPGMRFLYSDINFIVLGELVRRVSGKPLDTYCDEQIFKPIGAALHVIKMVGYKRNFWFDETGLQWVNPSPNIRSLKQAALYPGVALIEGTNVSVGRGTETLFEMFGAPWIHAKKLAEYLTKRQISGIRFVPADFTPKSNPYKNQRCHGVRVILNDRNALDSPALGIEIASALHRLYPKDFQLDKTLPLIGSRKVLQSVKNGGDPRQIVKEWQQYRDRFRKMRAHYMLY
ncbi:MAG: DUF1343 domain-containing protein [Nitrospirales bacterium]|nr:MAG: DUF1343 domain-containing protein [Nitrospirales bacterium]